MDNLIRVASRQTAALLKSGKVSPQELIDPAEKHISKVEPPAKALPTLCPERTRNSTQQIMARPAGELSPYKLFFCPKVITPFFEVNIRYMEEFMGGTYPSSVDWLIRTLTARSRKGGKWTN